jgi:hypothetical protein
MDLLKLPKSKKGNKYLLVMMDHFTHWTELRALPSKDMEPVARAFYEDVMCRHGCPEKVLTDRGTEFVNNVLRWVTEGAGAESIKTSRLNPRGNSLVERMNRWLIKGLGSYVEDKETDWNQYVWPIHSHTTPAQSMD